MVKRKSRQAHAADVASVAAQVAEWRKKKEKSATLSYICISKKEEDSNVTRQPDYKRFCATLNVSSLNSVIEVDTNQQTVYVEPGVTMEELVEATLPLGYLPQVMPEFKNITVGGAIQGAALESSSFRYGQMNDACTEFEVILSDGSIVICSATDHSDLFYCMASSYGSIGILVGAVIQLIPCQPTVKVVYEVFPTVEQAVSQLEHLSRSQHIDFVEGLVLKKNKVAVIHSIFTPDAVVRHDDTLPFYSFGDSRMDSFFWKHVDAVTDPPSLCTQLLGSCCRPHPHHHLSQSTASATEDQPSDDYTVQNCVHQEYLSTEQYVFRYDYGAFWFGSMYTLDIPCLRCCCFNSLSTKQLYKRLHHIQEIFTMHRVIIQDCYIPFRNATAFISLIQSMYTVYPLWLCPIRSTCTPQPLSPHYTPTTATTSTTTTTTSTSSGDSTRRDPLLLNVGIYGTPEAMKTPFTFRQLHQLEVEVQKAEGRKMLYSHNLYSEQEFWNVYDRNLYDEVRRKYKSTDAFLNVYDKTLAEEAFNLWREGRECQPGDTP